MKLHICTISSRNSFLEEIWRSIPAKKDIVWHIVRGSEGAPLPGAAWMENDKRIRANVLECADTDTPAKMNFIFKEIVKTDADSYFCILDDDTIFHENMYKLYRKYKRKKFMVIGRQEDKNGLLRLQGTLPYECAIDSGNVFCHAHVLVPEKWPDKHWDESYHADFDFWNRCCKHFSLQYIDISTKIISVYNKFSNKPDTLNYVR